MVAGPIVGEAIGGPEDSCLCADNVELDLRTGGPPFDAPPHLGVCVGGLRKKSPWVF